MKRVLIFFSIIIFAGCMRNLISVNKNELFSAQKTDKEILAEKKSEFKDMLSISRSSGDIRGIWYMKNADIKQMSIFLNFEIKPTTGYCIEVAGDSKSAKIFFTVTDKIFDVRIEKITDTKYSMLNDKKRRAFEVINLSHIINKSSKKLIWFFDDSQKYNTAEGSEQLKNGSNYFDSCTENTDYDCTVQGCLKRIKAMDDIADAESEGPLGNDIK